MIKKTRKVYEGINVELKVVEIDILPFLVNLSYNLLVIIFIKTEKVCA